MIKHHPQQALLAAHAEAALPMAISIAVSAHCEMCPECQKKLDDIQRQLADTTFETSVLFSENDELNFNQYGNSADDDSTSHNVLSLATTESARAAEIEFENMLEVITAKPAAKWVEQAPSKVNIKQRDYQLPRAFNRQTQPEWQSLGKVSRMRLNLDQGTSRASLIHIDAGGEIPEHDHHGQELTLLLAGKFTDEHSDYAPGDFIVLNKSHQHSPKTMEGCLCYTVVDAPLHFTKGVSKLLNPIGKLIY